MTRKHIDLEKKLHIITAEYECSENFNLDTVRQESFEIEDLLLELNTSASMSFDVMYTICTGTIKDCRLLLW